KNYTLHILNSVKSANGDPLKNQIAMKFTIKNDIVAVNKVVDKDIEYEVFKLVNEVRANHKLPPLKLYKELSVVAREKSRDLMVNNYFDHKSPTYGSPFDMMKKFGITYRSAGENIAGGFDTPEEVMVGWM